ncbi:hypothetical protein [Micromonospora sp. SL4-19]|uniref:hypothetical protein n=1 Tax=Micromonospora sp. SL4-19 TaxID=3399129 RepID=UPI003A4D42ED
MDRRPRRRLRSATVQLGALTALALALSGCNLTDDDDDCALGPAGGGGGTVTQALRVSAPAAARDAPAPALPARGGFGTHLASCGG